MNREIRMLAVVVTALVSVYVGIIISLYFLGMSDSFFRYTNAYLAISAVIILIGLLKLSKDMKILTKKMEEDAYLDHETGIPNKLSTLNKVSEAISESIVYDRKCAVALIEFDYAKNSNSLRGHDFVEKAIKLCIKELNKAISDEHIIGRLCDNELLVIVKDHISYNDIRSLSKSIIDQFENELIFDDIKVRFTTSVGVAIYSKDIKSSYDLIKKADIALSYIKSDNTSGYMIFDENIETLNKEEKYIKEGMIRAVKRNDLQIEYNPIVSLHDLKEVSFEASAIWQLQSKAIDRNKFYEIAEKYSVNEEVDLGIIKKVCNDIVLNNLSNVHFTIKVSTLSLESTRFLEELRSVMVQTQVDQSMITISLNGNKLARHGTLSYQRIENIRRMGCKVEIDNINATNSTLKVFNDIHVDHIKLDSNFIDAIGNSNHDEELIKSAIRISNIKHAEVIASGVNTRLQAEFLIKNNVNKVQGAFFAKPLKVNEVRSYLNEHKI